MEVVMPIVLLDGPPTPITLDAAAAALTAALITCGLGGPDAPGRGLGGIVVEIGSEVNVDEESKLLLLLLLVLVVVVRTRGERRKTNLYLKSNNPNLTGGE